MASGKSLAVSSMAKPWVLPRLGMSEITPTGARHRSGSGNAITELAGSRNIGKAIMPWSAFAHLYSAKVGYEDNGPLALKISKSFAKSSCSLEVKAGAREASKIYAVDDFS